MRVPGYIHGLQLSSALINQKLAKGLVTNDSFNRVNLVGAPQAQGINLKGLTITRDLGLDRSDMKSLHRIESGPVHRGIK